VLSLGGLKGLKAISSPSDTEEGQACRFPCQQHRGQSGAAAAAAAVQVVQGQGNYSLSSAAAVQGFALA
jgi:hypothetical protein